MDSNKKHPEQKRGEVLLGNEDNATYKASRWKTKRKGKIAYNPSGQALSGNSPVLYPIFVKRAEVKKIRPQLLKRLESE